jgi:two-component system nitrate/nitrite response regulator NarL
MVEEIRVLVVDDHALFRRGVIQTINQEPGMTAAGEADTAACAIERAGELHPDVVLLDIKLPDRSGLTVVGMLRSACPGGKIIVLTAMEDEGAVLKALKAGAHGYILKGVSAEELVRVIQSVHCGETYITPSMAGRLLVELGAPGASPPASRLLGELTMKERTILDLVAQGNTNKEIAVELYVSERTIKHHMTNVLQKLQVRNRVEAALLAKRDIHLLAL